MLDCCNGGEGNLFVANLGGKRVSLRSFLCLRAALGSWQYAVLNWAVDSVNQLLQVGRLQLGRLAVLAGAAPGTSLDEPRLEDLKLDELVVLGQPDVPLPVALFPSQRLKLYWSDIVHTCCRFQPEKLKNQLGKILKTNQGVISCQPQILRCICTLSRKC